VDNGGEGQNIRKFDGHHIWKLPWAVRRQVCSHFTGLHRSTLPIRIILHAASCSTYYNFRTIKYKKCLRVCGWLCRLGRSDCEERDKWLNRQKVPWWHRGGGDKRKRKDASQTPYSHQKAKNPVRKNCFVVCTSRHRSSSCPTRNKTEVWNAQIMSHEEREKVIKVTHDNPPSRQPSLQTFSINNPLAYRF